MTDDLDLLYLQFLLFLTVLPCLPFLLFLLLLLGFLLLERTSGVSPVIFDIDIIDKVVGQKY